MAAPVDDSYSAPSGQTIYAGRSGLPSWVPAVGQRANVSLNTVSDVYPSITLRGSTRFSAILNSWVGTAFAPTLGAKGSIIFSGGGHGDYLGNEVYRYDVATRLVTRIADPYPIPVSPAIGYQANDPTDGNGTGSGVSDSTYGEYWSDDTKSSVVIGQMCPTHTYGHVVHVSGAAAGNVNGWLVIVGNFSFQCHKVDLDNPSAGWSRLGPLISTSGGIEGPAYGCSVFDSIRNRIVCWPFGNGAQSYAYGIALPSGTPTKISANYVDSYYAVAHHDVVDDVYLIMNSTAERDGSSRLKLFVHDPADGARYDPISTGSVPPAGSGSVEWIESSRQLVFWPGTGTKLYFGQAPANPRTGTWTWAMRDFPGDAPVGNPDGWPLYARLHYVSSLDALIHVGSTTSPVQCWHL